MAREFPHWIGIVAPHWQAALVIRPDRRVRYVVTYTDATSAVIENFGREAAALVVRQSRAAGYLVTLHRA